MLNLDTDFIVVSIMLRAEKKLMRGEIRKRLTDLTEAYVVEESSKIATRAVALPCFTHAKSTSIYLAMTKEVQTRELLEAAFSSNKLVHVPKIIGSNFADMVMPRIVSLSEIDAFPRNFWGIPELPKEELASRPDGSICADEDDNDALIDIVLTPGVAFDTSCHRLGHGKGYYDSFLSRLNERRAELKLPPVITIGLALQEQMVECVPVGDTDVALDFIVTPDAVYTRSSVAVAAASSDAPVVSLDDIQADERATITPPIDIDEK